MEARTALPLDIFLYIIDLLAGGDDEDIKSLQILSLACKSMVPLCRKHLFSSLCLDSKSIFRRLSELLSINPDIACYVKNLNYKIRKPISDHELHILDMLKERSSLQSIKLSSLGLNWNNLPESIRSSLISLIELPTIALLDIDSINTFPATAFSGCSNLNDLQLRELGLVLPEVNHAISGSHSKIPTPTSLYINGKVYSLAALLNSASHHAVDPIVDFSRLQIAMFEVEFPGDISLVNELIKVTTRLEYLEISTCIHVKQPMGLAGVGASLAVNAYRTLKLLDFSITVVGDHYDPLCGLNHELGFIAGNNILEGLKLDVVVQDDASCRTESDDWSAFDSVLTKSGAFPMLRRVSVGILWYSVFDEDEESGWQDHVLESLKEDKFPRLVESKAVEFKFRAEIRYEW